MPRASCVLTLPSLRAESIPKKKWSERGELETIGITGFVIFCCELNEILRTLYNLYQ